MKKINFAKRAGECLHRVDGLAKQLFIGVLSPGRAPLEGKLREEIEKALRAVYKQGVQDGARKTKTDAAQVIAGLSRGDCFCEVAIGNPMMRSHSAACENVRKWLNE